MPFYTHLTKVVEGNSKNIGCVYSFAEMCDSKIKDIQDWMSSETTKYSGFEVQLEDGLTRVCMISSDMYQDALENAAGEYAVFYNDTQSLQITADELLAAVENSIVDLNAQRSFINYILQAGEVKLSELIGYLKDTVVGIPSGKLDWYKNITNGCSSPIEALTNFFSYFKTQTPSIQNQRIEFHSNSEYQGNVLEVATVQMGETIQGMFDTVVKALSDVTRFGEIVCEGLLKFGRVIFGSLLGALLTNYDKASNAVVGYLDYPIFTFYTRADNFNAVIDRMFSGVNVLTSYSWSRCNFQIKPDTSWTDARGNIDFKKSFKQLFTDQVDGIVYDSVTQVIIPLSNSGFSFMLQAGKLSNDFDQIAIQGYLVCSYAEFSKYSDAEIPSMIFDVVKEFLRQLDEVAPFSDVFRTVDDDSVHWTEETEWLWYIQPPQPHQDSTELYDYARRPKTQCNIYASDKILRFVRSLWLYMAVMSKGFVDTNGNNITNSAFLTIFNGSNSFTYVAPEDREDYESLFDYYEVIPGETFLENFSLNTYRPYNKNFFMTPSVHYQLVSERAQEVTDLIYRILIMAAVIVATVKVLKFRKKLTKSMFLASAEADKLSWDYAADPSAANLEKFNKAYRKAKRLNLLGSLLGISSEFAAKTAADNLISQQIASNFTGSVKNNNTNTNTLNTEIKKVDRHITGITD